MEGGMDASAAGFSCGCTCMPSASWLHLILHTRGFIPAHTSRARRMLSLVCSSDRSGFGASARHLSVRSGLGSSVVYLFVRNCVALRLRAARATRRSTAPRRFRSRNSFHRSCSAASRRVCTRVLCGRARARACVRVRACVFACACVCVVQRYDACVSTPEYIPSSLCCGFAFVQRYYAWLDKTAAYTRDTPAGHVSVRP
jgi:hypothetical protein